SSDCALLGTGRALRRLFTAAKRRDRTGPRRLRAFRLSKSFRLSHERDEVYPLALVGHGDELVPVPTPLYGRGDPVERPADESQSLIAVPSEWTLAAAARTGTGPSLGTLAVLVEPERRHGSAIIAADAIGMLSRLCGRVSPSPALVTQNVARATGSAGAPKNARLLESKERSAGQLGRDPADPRDISRAHPATGGGKPERLLLYRCEANSTRQHGLDEPLPTELGKHDIRRGHPPVTTPHHGTPNHGLELSHIA